MDVDVLAMAEWGTVITDIQDELQYVLTVVIIQYDLIASC